MKDIKKIQIVLRRIGDWVVNGDVGLSSKCLLSVFLGANPKFIHHPVDPSDFHRCYIFLEKVLDFEDNMPLLFQMSKKSKQWETIWKNYYELRRLYLKGKNQKEALELYKYMKELGL